MNAFINVSKNDPNVRVKINNMLDILDYHLIINRKWDMIL